VVAGNWIEEPNTKPDPITMKKISAVILACSTGIAVQAQVIDDFSSDSSLNYNQAILLAQSADPAAVFGISSGTLQVSQANYTSGAQQQVYIRNDGYSLGVGQTLRVDVISPSQNSVYSDFGLALMETASPTSVNWTTGTADGRNGLLDLYIKGQYGTIGYRASDAANTQLYSSAGVSITGGISALTGLWITRASSTEFDVGYSTASGDTQILAMTGLDSTMGAGLGFYSDVRANTTYGYLDNLRLVAVPEPSTLAMCGLGAFGLLFAARRKK
jgi:hypothetical protein